MAPPPLEDQLRSMILKNSGPGDNGQQPLTDNAASVRRSNRPQRAAAPQSQQTPPPNAASPRAPRQQRHPPQHGRGHSGPGRQHIPHASPQHHHQGQGHVPPHLRNRSMPGDFHQERGGFHQHNSPLQHGGPRHLSISHGPGAGLYAQGPGQFGGSPANFRPGPPLQILQRPPHSAQGPSLYDQNGRWKQQINKQCNYLTSLAAVEIPRVAMTEEEFREKRDFVERLQKICQSATSKMPNVPSLEFKCFGSIGTGFATKGSDIDLAVIASIQENTELAKRVGPRVLEKVFLDNGFGARLLTNTRVPIIKFCEKPSKQLHENLVAERKKWDDLPEEERNAMFDSSSKDAEGDERQDESHAAGKESFLSPNDTNGRSKKTVASAGAKMPSQQCHAQEESSTTAGQVDAKDAQGENVLMKREPRPEKPWLRERPLGPLDFPKEGVGIQCDLNFAGHLGIYNTQLLHCYAISDERVRDMVIFVKTWAKTRKINSSYNGTLSSYGYALMVLHYLMRVPEEPVIPDLQLEIYPTNGGSPKWTNVTSHGHTVKFVGDEEYILDKVRKGKWTRNEDSLGSLLRGFFGYYGCPGIPDRVGGFHWTRDVITFGQRKHWERMVTKEELGWTKARVEKDSKKEVRHRYLVCIQDPFELDHNVGRTVNHQGICAIREEFRRAWRILEAEAQGKPHKDLFATVDEDPPPPQFVATGPPKVVAAITDDVHVKKDQAEAGLEQKTHKAGIHSTVDGAKPAATNLVVGLGAEAIAKVNRKLVKTRTEPPK